MYIASFAETAPDRAAVVMGESGRRITYKELDEGSDPLRPRPLRPRPAPG